MIYHVIMQNFALWLSEQLYEYSNVLTTTLRDMTRGYYKIVTRFLPR